jgi:hypothetical protein
VALLTITLHDRGEAFTIDVEEYCLEMNRNFEMPGRLGQLISQPSTIEVNLRFKVRSSEWEAHGPVAPGIRTLPPANKRIGDGG